jgi:hypothetical protein
MLEWCEESTAYLLLLRHGALHCQPTKDGPSNWGEGLAVLTPSPVMPPDISEVLTVSIFKVIHLHVHGAITRIHISTELQ